VLDSALWLLTMTAVVLLVPACAALLGVERHRHLAPSEDTSRRVRLVVAATLVGLAALGVSALLDAEPLTAVVVAVVLAGSVLAWAQMSSTWAVRGVVMWALLVTGAVAFLAWLAQQMASSDMDAAQLVVAAAAGLLLVLVLSRGQRYVRASIGAHAGLESGSGRAPLPVLRPLGTLVALLAAGGVVVAVAEDGPGTPGPDPQAGGSGTGTVTEGSPSGGSTSSAPPSAPSSAPTPTLGLAPEVPVAPSAVDAGLVAATTAPRGDIRVTTAGLAPSAPVGVPVASHDSSDDGGGSSSTPSGEAGKPGTGGSTPTRPPAASPATGNGGPGGGSGGGNGSGSGSGRTGSGGTGTGGTGTGGTGSGGTGSGGTGTGGTGSGGTGSGGTGSGGADTGGTDTGSGGTGSGDSGDEPDAGTPDPPVVVAIRTPGYVKPKPHRPIDAPSPGHGRLNNHLDEPSPVPSTTMYAPPPTLLPIPAPTPMRLLLATLQPEPTKTPGWAKERPNSPKQLRP
jgi:hypothetical protein